MKKILSILLSIVLIINLSTPTYALQNNGDASADDVAHAMKVISDSLSKLEDTASDASTLVKAFNSFMDVVRTSGQVLTAVNGSVAFLRLIGIMNDPTQSKLDSILDKLQIIDERLSSMDDKLNDLTTMMSELKASVEFNARTEKAILYEASWRDFKYRYMEDGMDKLMAEYNSMLRSGLMNWCNGSRNEGGIDNSKIIVAYDSDGNVIYSDANTPSSQAEAWIILPETCLPSNFSYDVNTFNENLQNEIKNNILNALKSKDNVFETKNMDANEENANSIALDAVNTLIYRVACAQVNSNSSFAGEVSRQFSNYCSHLQSIGDGIDATLKTMYLTHAFEYSVKDDLRNFIDRMIVVTGTYGMFASNVLGMSHLTTDNEKIAAINQMTSAIATAEEAKNNGITGNDHYCYITGTNLEYSTITFDGSASIDAHYTMSNTTYESYQAKGPTVHLSVSNASPIGDAAMIILVNTLLSNGVSVNHDYFNKYVSSQSNNNYGKIITGYGGVQNFTIEGKVKLHVKNAFGNYFKNDSTISSLPEDAENEYVVYRKKISGSIYDTSTRALTSNATLSALAVYGENHFYWVTDEGGFMSGPSDNSSFKDSYKLIENGSDSTGKNRQHRYEMENSYNILLSIPCDTLSSGDYYNPIVSFNEEFPPVEYNENDYYQEQNGLLGAKNNDEEKEETVLIIASDYQEAQEEVVTPAIPVEESNHFPLIQAFAVAGIAIVILILRKKTK